jgi:hypothetical protein
MKRKIELKNRENCSKQGAKRGENIAFSDVFREEKHRESTSKYVGKVTLKYCRKDESIYFVLVARTSKKS